MDQGMRKQTVAKVSRGTGAVTFKEGDTVEVRSWKDMQTDVTVEQVTEEHIKFKDSWIGFMYGMTCLTGAHGKILKIYSDSTIKIEFESETLCQEAVDLLANNEVIFVGNMLSLVGDTDLDNEGDDFTLNLSVSKDYNAYDSDLVNEMLSKISLADMRKLGVVSTSGQCTFNDFSYMEDTLAEWARNKLWLYELFGRKLRVSREVERDMDKDEMSIKIVALKKKFPKYALVLNQFATSEFLENKVKGNHTALAMYAPFITSGMKLSKFLSKFLSDDKFDIELSKMLQNKKVKGQVVLSIHPVDILLASHNKHGWDSCHDISGGSYSLGPWAYLADTTTAIAFYSSTDKVEFKEFGVSYKAYSMRWRQMVYIDNETMTAVFSREYPAGEYSNKVACDAVRSIYENLVFDMFNIPEKYRVFKVRKQFDLDNLDTVTVTNNSCGLVYNDAGSNYNVSVVVYKYLEGYEYLDVELEIGESEHVCPMCGDTHDIDLDE